MSFLGCCVPGINLDIIIYFCLLHNQGGRFKIVSTIGHVLCVLLFINDFVLSVLITILIFLRSIANLEFHESMFHNYVASTECLIISTSCLCFSLCHHNNFDSFLLAKQLFRTAFSSVAVLVIITIFSTIESVESTNRAFPKVFILTPTI
jgi:hypothetical protein